MYHNFCLAEATVMADTCPLGKIPIACPIYVIVASMGPPHHASKQLLVGDLLSQREH